jgi:hypothetical protein
MVLNPSILASCSTPALLAWVAFRNATGVLVVSDDAGNVFDIAVHAAAISLVERRGGDLVGEAVDRLVASKTIAADVALRARQLSNATGKSLVQVLFEMGACTPAALVESIRAGKTAILDAVIALKQARFEWREGARPDRRPDPVTIELNLFLVNLMRARLRTTYIQDLDPLLAPFQGKFPVKAKRLTPPLAMTCLNDKERKVLDQIADGATTLRDVFPMSVLSRNQTARLFHTCNFLGWIEWLGVASPRGGIAELEAELKKTWERVSREDHFLRLGAHWTTHPAQLEPAFRKMVARWGESSPARAASPTCAELCDGILRLIRESYEVLRDDRQRQAYRRQIVEEIKLRFGSDFLFKQAHMALFRGEVENARNIVEAAIDISPQPEYVAFRRTLTGGTG